jgi:hypothetical protein
MKSKDALENTTNTLDQLSKVVLVASNSWDNELEFRLRKGEQNKTNNRTFYPVFFGLLFIINISVLVFSTSTSKENKAVRQQDLKMLREELLIPNTL